MTTHARVPSGSWLSGSVSAFGRKRSNARYASPKTVISLIAFPWIPLIGRLGYPNPGSTPIRCGICLGSSRVHYCWSRSGESILPTERERQREDRPVHSVDWLARFCGSLRRFVTGGSCSGETRSEGRRATIMSYEPSRVVNYHRDTTSLKLYARSLCA